MKSVTLTMILALFSKLCFSGELLDKYSTVQISEIYTDSVSEKRQVDLLIKDQLSKDTNLIKGIEFSETNLRRISEPFYIDWKHERVYFAPSEQKLLPGWFFIDLEHREAKPAESELLSSLYGHFALTPECNFIVVFSENPETSAPIGENRSLLSTYVFDATSMQLLSKKDSFTALTYTYPPKYFFSSDDSYLFVVDPFTLRENTDVIRIKLPELEFQDTIRVNEYCLTDCNRSFVTDIKNNVMLSYTSRFEQDKTISEYIAVNINSKELMASIEIDQASPYPVAVLSKKSDFVLLQSNVNEISVFGIEGKYLYNIKDIREMALSKAVFTDSTFFVSPVDPAVLNEYKLSNGQLVKSIVKD